MATNSAAAHMARLNATLAELTARRDALVAAFPVHIAVPTEPASASAKSAGDASGLSATSRSAPVAVTNGHVDDAGAGTDNGGVVRMKAKAVKASSNFSDSIPVSTGAQDEQTPPSVAIPQRPPLPSTAAHTRPHLHSNRQCPPMHDRTTNAPPDPITTPQVSPPPTSTSNHPPIPTPAQTAATLTFAHATIQTHIRRLHDYNAVRDVAQGLMGLLADRRGVRLVEVMDEFGVGAGD